MSLVDLYHKRQSEKEQAIKKAKSQAPISLAARIEKTYSDPSLVERIENHLIEYGSVTVHRGPCTCEDGGCKDTVGFKEYLKDFIQKWEDKGVLIIFSVTQTFTLKGIKVKESRIDIPRK